MDFLPRLVRVLHTGMLELPQTWRAARGQIQAAQGGFALAGVLEGSGLVIPTFLPQIPAAAWNCSTAGSRGSGSTAVHTQPRRGNEGRGRELLLHYVNGR